MFGPHVMGPVQDRCSGTWSGPLLWPSSGSMLWGVSGADVVDHVRDLYCETGRRPNKEIELIMVVVNRNESRVVIMVRQEIEGT